jgi:hypothetical protein
MRIALTFTFVILLAALGSAAFTTASTTIEFPEDYQRWTRVKTTLVGPASPQFSTNGGYHHFYANAKAIEGYRTGTFPDGSILVDDGLAAVDVAGVSSEGARVRVAVMEKDSRRFAASSNWGFEVFPRDSRSGSLDEAGKAACLACHVRAKRDLVFGGLK